MALDCENEFGPIPIYRAPDGDRVDVAVVLTVGMVMTGAIRTGRPGHPPRSPPPSSAPST
jgi:hypothetical protein